MIPFSGNPLNRASERRTDQEWIGAKQHEPTTRIWPLWRLKPFLLGGEDREAASVEAGYLQTPLACDLAPVTALSIFLGLDEDGAALFALDVASDVDPSAEGPLAGLGHFRDARTAAQLLPLEDAAILGQAKALIDWHQRHGFCPNCGARTALADAGYRRHCESCGADHFPRTDPVVIMLAIHEDACLVGRAPRFPKGMFSALAGFIEPGETIEEAVARELYEEAGVRVRDVSYFATQPWPFPSSLMIGCFARAESREISLNDHELAEAFWLEKAKVRALLAGEKVDGLWVPPSIAIAHHLLKRFAEMS
ncbi:MAG: NAD(+) diphosphatase [Alphaproteobacteria bacterium]|nr:NAD(+) diphosphatase [Alphaproteobacteria bacterium]